jgi:hypothetical protein
VIAHGISRDRIHPRAGHQAPLWKWGATVSGVKISGQGSSREEAIADAEKAINRALAPKKRRLKRD